MYLLLVILMLIASVLMCFIVLIQITKEVVWHQAFHHPTKLWVCARLRTFW